MALCLVISFSYSVPLTLIVSHYTFDNTQCMIQMQLEGEATARAIQLAAFVNTPLYVVHVMSIDAMEEISKARKSGF